MSKKRLRGILTTVIAKNSKTARSVYWYNRKPNFGDLLTPDLMKYYGYRPLNCSPYYANIICVGSILQHVPTNYSGIILGAGLIEDRNYSLPHADFRAVRGPLTRSNVNAPADVALGDPGLLANRLLEQREKKRTLLGLVPHLVDQEEHIFKEIKNLYPDKVCIIDVRKKPREVIREIDQCEYIISSSLHGLVVADSLGVPANWARVSDRILGNGFKFRDYNAAVSASCEPTILRAGDSIDNVIETTRTPGGDLDAMAFRLEKLFLEL